jgi:membrane fusion protein (multidrug efflux system)
MSDSPTDSEIARADTTQSPSDDNGLDQTHTPRKNAESGSRRNDVEKDRVEEARRNERRPLVIAGGILVVVLLVAGGLFYWISTRNLESTDDAYTDGRAIAIAPQISGMVTSLDVTDNQFVKQGQPLIHIDRRQYETDREQAEGALATARSQYAGQQFGAEIARKNFPALLEQAQAQLAIAQASLSKAQADYDRQQSLSRPATSQQEVDAATAALKQAQAQVMLAEAQVLQNSPVPQRIGETDAQVNQLKGQIEQAQAKLDQADLNLSWTVVSALQDGWITKRNVEKGTYVAPGQQIFSIVAPEVWVTANFKESQLADMRKGQPVKIRIDAYPALDLRGHVDSIQLGSGSKFTAFPPENATGNFVKVVQRVPVKIVIDSGLDPNIPLPLGISVEPTVTVR